MAEKAAAIVGCRSGLTSRSSEAGLLATWGEADSSMIAQTDALGVLIGTVPVEMIDKGGGRHILLVGPLIFVCRLDTAILSGWVGEARNMHPPHFFQCCAIGCCRSVF